MKTVMRQRGFSLLELLVALVVFSIGLLAVAGLQTVSKQANFEGLQRTTASQIANGLLEDMRVNGDAVNTYLGAGELGGGARGGQGLPRRRDRVEAERVHLAGFFPGDVLLHVKAVDRTAEAHAEGFDIKVRYGLDATLAGQDVLPTALDIEPNGRHQTETRDDYPSI